jgi:hypothetical protein
MGPFHHLPGRHNPGMGKEGEDPLTEMRSAPTSDPRDDWLGAGGGNDLEWFPDEPTSSPSSRPPQAGADRPIPGPPPAPGTIRRRREIAIVVGVLVLVAAVILAIVAIGGTGGGSPAATTTPPVTTTPAVTTTPVTTPATTTTTTQQTTTTTPATTSGEVVLPQAGKLKPGDTGAEVKTLQKALVKIGAAPSLTVDGTYGPSTQAAVTAFQRSNGLTADGVVGKETAAANNAALAQA